MEIEQDYSDNYVIAPDSQPAPQTPITQPPSPHPQDDSENNADTQLINSPSGSQEPETLLDCKENNPTHDGGLHPESKKKDPETGAGMKPNYPISIYLGFYCEACGSYEPGHCYSCAVFLAD